jgi:putative glutamine amidotransferase
MKLIAVSQRVDSYPERQERRDALDQRYATLLAACGCRCLPVPNLGAATTDWLAALPIHGLLLSGGNDLAALGGDAPERDASEAAMLAHARLHDLPLVGICRGMQFLAHALGGTLDRREGHAGTRHAVAGEITATVNSFHAWCVHTPPADFDVLARATDGSIEAMRHRSERLLGLMWHPEREHPHATDDLTLLANFLNRRGDMP